MLRRRGAQIDAMARRPMAPLLLKISLIGLIGLWIAFGFACWFTYNQAVREGRRVAGGLSSLVESQTSRMIEAADLTLLTLADIASSTNWADPANVERARRRMDRFENTLPYAFRLFIIDANGDVRLSSMDRTPPLNVADRDYFRAHRAHHPGLHISPLLRSLASGEPIFILSRAITDDEGRFAGVVTFSFEVNNLRKYYLSLRVPYASTFELIHADMTVLVSEPPLPDMEPNVEGGRILAPPALRAQIASAPSGTIDYVGRDGTERIGAYSKLAGYPLYVEIGISRQDVFNRWRDDVLLPLLFALGALAASTLLVFAIVQRARQEDRAAASLETRVKERTAELENTVAEKEVLLRETHHRVKNNLQVIASLLSLQAQMAPGPKEGYAESLRRIHAMGRLHQQFYQANRTVKTIEMGPYLRDLCLDIVASYGLDEQVDIAVDAPDVALDLDTSTSLALLVTETVSNACKHAFPDGRRGTIRLWLGRENGDLRLTIQDDGVGLPRDYRSGLKQSLGLRLIDLLAKQLGARNVGFSDGNSAGTVFTLVFQPA